MTFTCSSTKRLGALALLWLVLPMAGALPAAAEEDNQTSTEISLVLVQEGDQLRGFSFSMARGTHVETAAALTDNGVATGAIASVNPVSKHEHEGGFDLFTSPVGTATGP